MAVSAMAADADFMKFLLDIDEEKAFFVCNICLISFSGEPYNYYPARMFLINCKTALVLLVLSYMNGEYPYFAVRCGQCDFIFTIESSERNHSLVISPGGDIRSPGLVNQLIQHYINRFRTIFLIYNSTAR